MQRRRWPTQTLIEGGFIAFLVVLCAILTALQYRWTGELSRAAADRLRTGFNNQAQLLCRAFDSELTEACNQLVPRAAELEQRGRESVHMAHLRSWLAGKPRPIFRRLGVVVPEKGALQIYGLDPRAMQLSPLAWPAGWEALRENLTPKAAGGRTPPFENTTGALFEFPVFSDARPPAGPPELEWMILELDLDYVRETWLPELVQIFLNAGGSPVHEIAVKTVVSPQKVIYATSDRRGQPAGESGTTVLFNRQGRPESDEQLPGGKPRWLLTVWDRPGALEAIVSASRRRNLALACVLNALILASGVALVRFTRRSRELAEAQMQFVAAVSHELRTPLTVIRGAAHNLQRGIVRERAGIERYAGLIIQHSDQLAGMVEQVVEFAAVKKRQTVVPHESVALAEVLGAAIAATTPEAQAASCEVQAQIPADLPVVNGDASALRRVFQNLITNAAKHGGRGGWIGVTATCSNGKARPTLEVRIADRGPGIPKEEQAGIFQPFFRGAAAQTRQTRGSGLGLSLVREIVEAHGGTVSVRSQHGEGATFIVRLPAAAADRGADSTR